MATIASLAVSLTARIGNFEKGFKKASKIAKSFGKNLEKVTRKVRRFGAVVIGVAAAALTFMIKKQLALIDSTAKMADVLGLTTEELVGFQLGAKIVGIEVGQLNAGFTRLQKNIGDAGDGLAAPIRSLKKLGLTAEQLKSMTTADQVTLIAERFNTLTNQIDKSNVLLNLFGRSGLALGRLLETGAGGIERFKEEAIKAGTAFNRVDAAQVEAANDAVERAKESVVGMVNSITIQLAPWLKVLAERFRQFAMQSQLSGNEVVTVIERIFTAFAKLTDMISLLKSGWFGFVAGVTGSTSLILKSLNAKKNAIQYLAKLLEKDIPDTFWQALEGEFVDATFDAAENAKKFFKQFQEGFASKKAADFFKTLKSEANAAEAAIESAGSAGVKVGASAPTGEDKKFSSFEQINTSRVVIGGIRAEQDRTLKLQKEGNNFLEQIAHNTGQGMALVTA